MEMDFDEAPWVEDTSPKALFICLFRRMNPAAAYEKGWKITDIFPLNAVGI